MSSQRAVRRMPFGLLVLAGAGACAHVSSNQTPPAGLPTSPVTTNASVSSQWGAAQFQSPLAGCPGGNGIHISVNSGTEGFGTSPANSLGAGDTASRVGSASGSDSASRATGNANDSLSRTNTASDINIGVDQRNSIDTTLVFDVAHKTWTRTNLAATITAGLADQARGGYAICAGVTALIPSANLTITGARGRVHFAATLQNLLNSIQSGPAGTTSQLRRM